MLSDDANLLVATAGEKRCVVAVHVRCNFVNPSTGAPFQPKRLGDPRQMAIYVSLFWEICYSDEAFESARVLPAVKSTHEALPPSPSLPGALEIAVASRA